MTVPSLAVQVQGQSAVTADNINTFVQNCTTAAVLRNFIGLPGMVVYLDGIASQNDGHAGAFYWNPTGVAPDDNLNVIVPTGAATGEWVRLSLGSSGGGPCTSIANSFQFNNAGAFGCNAGVISTHSGASAWGKSVDEIDLNGNRGGPLNADITSKSGVAAYNGHYNGYNLRIRAGSGAAASGYYGGGGIASIEGGYGKRGGGGVNINGGNAYQGSGGAVGIFSGYGSHSGNSGSITIQTGNANGAVGKIKILAGNSSNVASTPTGVYIGGGNASGEGSFGGTISIYGGGGPAGGGGVGVHGGPLVFSETYNFIGGSAVLEAGPSYNFAGAPAAVNGGSGHGAGTAGGGTVYIRGGYGGGTGGGSGGDVKIYGGGSKTGARGPVRLLFLPTSDPHINGAVWRSGGGAGVSGTLMLSTG